MTHIKKLLFRCPIQRLMQIEYTRISVLSKDQKKEKEVRKKRVVYIVLFRRECSNSNLVPGYYIKIF